MKLLPLIIKVASSAYPDDLIAPAFQGGNVGDGPATFIAEELTETNEGHDHPQDQFNEAIRCLRRANEEIMRVLNTLENYESFFLMGKKALVKQLPDADETAKMIIAERLKHETDIR